MSKVGAVLGKIPTKIGYKQAEQPASRGPLRICCLQVPSLMHSFAGFPAGVNPPRQLVTCPTVSSVPALLYFRLSMLFIFHFLSSSCLSSRFFVFSCLPSSGEDVFILVRPYVVRDLSRSVPILAYAFCMVLCPCGRYANSERTAQVAPQSACALY